MPKKSNKTDHVLNLLTSGNRIDDAAQAVPPAPMEPSVISDSPSPKPETAQTADVKVSTKKTSKQNEPVHFSVSPQAPASRVIVEETKQREDLSNLVKIGLEEELKSFTKTKTVSKPFIIVNDNNFSDAPISQVYSEKDMEFVTSRPYILEDFNENEEDFMSNVSKNANQTFSSDNQYDNGEFLHNMAEDIIKSKAPEIMESLNMCTCKSCVYDVVALALNNTKPLYTITKKGELFQKLASCEMQCGSDITSEITKACLKIKVNPRHDL